MKATKAQKRLARPHKRLSLNAAIAIQIHAIITIAPPIPLTTMSIEVPRLALVKEIGVLAAFKDSCEAFHECQLRLYAIPYIGNPCRRYAWCGHTVRSYPDRSHGTAELHC